MWDVLLSNGVWNASALLPLSMTVTQNDTGCLKPAQIWMFPHTAKLATKTPETRPQTPVVQQKQGVHRISLWEGVPGQQQLSQLDQPSGSDGEEQVKSTRACLRGAEPRARGRPALRWTGTRRSTGTPPAKHVLNQSHLPVTDVGQSHSSTS